MYTKIDNSIQSFKNNHYATQTDSELRCVVININETTEFAVRSMKVDLYSNEIIGGLGGGVGLRYHTLCRKKLFL